ncbi:MAG: glycosyltransferase family 4 protein, partial [Desulfobacteraceae bacterium]|nr:glycosyltransferase family 4 protein [Desulfobacteraceae bacterium]
MKILLFSSFLSSWNGVRPEAEIFIGIDKKGHQVYVASQAHAPYAKRFRDEGLQVIDCYPSGKICLRTIFKLRKIIKDNHIDIVYATNSRTIPNAAFACIKLPVKLINYRGTSRGLYRHDPGAYLTHLHPRVDGICCNAEAVRRDVIKRIWKNKNCVRTIYKGHDVNWFSDPKTDLSSLNIPANSFVVTCVANARPSKGVSVLLQASRFLQDIPNLYILIVGQNVDNRQYIDEKNKSPMASNIILVGFRNDAPQIIAASDIYVQPSTSREGMAKTVIEAMAQEIPPVITDAGGT